MKYIRTHIPDILIPLGFSIIAGICSIYLLFEAYQSFAYDLGLHVEVMQNAFSNPTMYSRLANSSYLGGHLSLILYPVAAIYKVFPYVQTLLVIQVLALAAAAPLIYYVARQFNLDRKTSLLIELLYVLNPLVWGLVNFDFHEICFAPLTVTVMIIGMLKKRWLMFGIGLFLSMVIKDDATMTVGAIGVSILIYEWFKHKRIDGYAATMTIGATIFMILTFVIASKFTADNGLSLQLSLYRGLFIYSTLPFGQAISGWAQVFFSLWSLALIAAFMLPLMFAPLGNIKWCFPALGILFTVMSSNFWGQHTKIFQYPAAAIPFLFMATIATLSTRPRVLKWFLRYDRLLILLAVFITMTPLGRYNNLTIPDDNLRALDAIVAQVPDNASVTCNNTIFNKLITRCNTYLAGNGFSFGLDYGYPYRQTEYVVISKWRVQYNWESDIKDIIGQKYDLVSEIRSNQLWKLKPGLEIDWQDKEYYQEQKMLPPLPQGQ